MPEKLDRCVAALIEKGYSEKEAWAICTAKIKKELKDAIMQKRKIITGQLIEENKEDGNGAERDKAN